MNDWTELLQTGKAWEITGRKKQRRERKGGAIWEVRAYSFPPSQIWSLHSFCSSPTARLSQRFLVYRQFTVRQKK